MKAWRPKERFHVLVHRRRKIFKRPRALLERISDFDFSAAWDGDFFDELGDGRGMWLLADAWKAQGLPRGCAARQNSVVGELLGKSLPVFARRLPV